MQSDDRLPRKSRKHARTARWAIEVCALRHRALARSGARQRKLSATSHCSVQGTPRRCRRTPWFCFLEAVLHHGSASGALGARPGAGRRHCFRRGDSAASRRLPALSQASLPRGAPCQRNSAFHSHASIAAGKLRVHGVLEHPQAKARARAGLVSMCAAAPLHVSQHRTTQRRARATLKKKEAALIN